MLHRSGDPDLPQTAWHRPAADAMRLNIDMVLNPAVASGARFHRSRRRVCLPLSLSLALHGLLVAIAMIGLSPRTQPADPATRFVTGRLTWAGAAGSPGRGSPETPEPRRTIAMKRSDGPQRADRIPPPQPEHPPILSFAVPPMPDASGLRNLPGVFTTLSPAGPAFDSSASGIGAGPCCGSGANGPGAGKGTGGAESGFGSGGGPVTLPTLISQVQPAYTAEALGARAQGTVTVEAMVRPNGSVGDVRILRSFASSFGLEAEAVRAVKQWRFRPGTRGGAAVPMLVTIELTFTLR